MATSYVSSTATHIIPPSPETDVNGTSVRLSWGLVAAGLLSIFGGTAALMALSFAAASAFGTAGEILSGVCAFGAIIAGAMLLFVSGVQACATCREPLQTRTLMLREDTHAELLESIEAGDLQLLSFLDQAPPADAATKARVGVEFEACPACQRGGWLTPVKLRWDDSRERFDPFECGEPVHKSARTMATIERLARARAASH